ncbi:FAD-dependent oxidoreductase, partial [Bacillus cereus group sp. Bce006]
SLVALGDYKGILGQFTGNGRIKVYVAFRMPSEKLDDYKALSVGELKEQLLEDFSDWDEDLKKYIKYASDDVMCRRIYKLPIGFKWD